MFLPQIIQDLRRQYSGSIPLSRQEKFSRTIIEMNEEKRRTNELLKEAEKKAMEAETKAEELAIKQDGVDELVATLKQGARTKQVRSRRRIGIVIRTGTSRLLPVTQLMVCHVCQCVCVHVCLSISKYD